MEDFNHGQGVCVSFFTSRPARIITFFGILCFSLAFFLYSQDPTEEPVKQPSQENSQQPSLDISKKIVKGDRLTIKVLEQEDLSGAYTVSSEGTVEFPLISERITAEGLTFEQLAAKIKEKLEGKYFYQATVIVSPFTGEETAFSSRASIGGVIYVYGAVNNTGAMIIPENENFTVSRAIIRSGGFKDFANKKKVKLIRKSQATGKTQITYLNMVDIIDKGKWEKDIIVRDGDYIIVSEKFFNF
jgi:polysaccharide export outer membrane protein